MTREGYIENIIYKNEDNGYAVFTVDGEDGEEIFVGTLYNAGEGLYIIAEGDYVNHPQYDIQFRFTSCELRMPDDIVGIEKYLASGIIKGIGAVRAKQIVKKFKTDTLRIMEEEPERLAEIKGISERQARLIAESYAEKKEFQAVVMFLSEYGISVNMGMKIYKFYGDKVYEVLRDNPYRLAEDITGIGFRAADEIAARMGVEATSEYRVRSAILYVLSTAVQEGHMYLPKELVFDRVREFLGNMDRELISGRLMELAIEGRVVIKSMPDETAVYSSLNYYTELNTARMLTDLQLRYEVPETELDTAIAGIERDTDIVLDEMQREAVKSAITAGVAVITGGPGTGKTTIIQAIIRYYGMQGMEIKLCAPTGRAAKRMTESTGWPAQTIHRLLEVTGVPAEGDDGGERVHFQRNSSNPLECDAIIVDEMSMVDNYIFCSLLQAVAYGTRLILVGDINQLPSVGAGNVLKDIISSECFPVTTLTKIFRQENGSDIVINAHKINRGEHLELANNSRDFFFIQRTGVLNTVREVKELVSDNLPKYLGISPMEVQVLTPMRKYELGVENMNIRLQELLNPPAAGKSEKERNGIVFREGDKVMQIKNNYKLDWKIYGAPKDGRGDSFVLDEGVGVFNGDMGIIKEISDYDEEVTVLFDDGRVCVYGYDKLDELEHAFAITIHKSQGSEYPAVVIPLVNGPGRLMNRNLLYTAITRARQMVVVVGNMGMVNYMIDNTEQQKRYTGLAFRLQELL